LLKIETKNLLIRNHIPADWRNLHEYLSIPEIYKFEPGKPVTSTEAKAMVIERSKSNEFLAVVHKNSEEMIGHLYFHQTNPREFMTWELGYIFNPKFHNQGYCTEASKAMIRYAFNQWQAHKVVAFCNPKNIPSWKVLEKIGMEREGLFRQKAFFRRDNKGNPIWHDSFAYGILNDDSKP